ncbi:RHS repeat-associated core domain-containing protein [Streptomyces sp. MMS24-I2-30]|uniref:RHS repeat-associated core domain-containing protein n=1 Tax=Streptomyces sp. MMS24-I2-30 TaxID=3351564 RepID=UPI003896CEB5
MVGHRPADWHPLDLDKDPTPGDPQRVRSLAKQLHDFADDVSDALRLVKGMAGEDTLLEWAGKSAEAFKEQFGGVPKDLKKLKTSYEMCGDALADYWPKLERAQALADRALAKAKEAQDDLSSAKSRLSSADSWVTRANKEADKYKDDPTGSKSDAGKPDEAKVRAATRDAQNAKSAHDNAQSDVTAAQSALDAAKKMAEDARKMRDEAAREAKSKIDEASDAGIQNRKWWQDIGHWFENNWDSIVAVCKVVVTVVGIVAMIIGGPILGAIVLVAALVVLADTLYKYSKGRASLWDVAFAALDCIPGGKGITSFGKLAKGMKGLKGLQSLKGGLKGMALGVKGAGRSTRSLGRQMKKLFTCGDPIDMATGQMVLSETDLLFDGVFPLELERHHRTGLTTGRWFGSGWTSTVDQRLILEPYGVRFVSADGMTLIYPAPDRDVPVLPVEGPRWPLECDSEDGEVLTVRRPEHDVVLRFRPQPGCPATELPLSSITDAKGNTVELAYGPDGTLREVVHSGGYRLGVTTEGGRISRFTLLSAPEQPTLVRYAYDTTGNLTEIYNSSGLPLKFHYDEWSRITGWEDRNGVWCRYAYDDENRCVSTAGVDGILDYTYAYDPEQHTSVATNSLGQSTTYCFNDAFQLISETGPLGHTVTRAWDRYDNLLALTDPLGRTTRYAYDEEGNTTRVVHPDGSRAEYAYGPSGTLLSAVEQDGAEWRYAYDDLGNVVAITDPVGATTGYRYDARGAVAVVTDALGGTSRVTSNAAGLPIEVTSPLGAVTRFAYDAFGRVVGVVEPDGGTTLVAWTTEGRAARRTFPDGSAESWTYDAEGNLLTHTDVRAAVTRFEPAPFDRTAARTAADGSRIEFTYDTELRPTSVRNAQGQTWTYEYDPMGNVVRETDFNGRTVIYRYDAAGRIVERVNGAGQTVRYRHDLLDRVIEQQDSDGRVTQFEYDRGGALLRAVNPDADLTFTYDANGRVLTESCNGRTVTNTYDAVGRRVRRRTPGGVLSEWRYDAGHQPAELRGSGRTVSFGHDLAGHEVLRSLPADASLRQEWSSTGHRLVSQGVRAHGAGTAQVARTYTYRADGLPSTVTDSAVGPVAYELDTNGRVTTVTADDRREAYAYDSLGNLVRSELDTPGGNFDTGVQGDITYRGTLVQTAGRSRYEHDAQGRVVRHTRTLLSGGHRTWTFAWDAEDRLRSVRTPEGSLWRYRYDPLGRRVAKERLGTDSTSVVERTDFVWDGTRPAEQTRSRATGAATREVTTWDWEPGGDRPLVQRTRSAGRTDDDAWVDERFYSIVTDVVGTPTELIDEDGRAAWHSRNTLWGLPLDSASSGSVDCPLRFPGQYFDAETGLHYNHHRYYDPGTARYHSPDPLGLEPAPHHHNYVVNPLVWADPLGLAPSCKTVIRHYTHKDGYNKIMGGGNKNGITLKVPTTTKGRNSAAVYVTPMSPADVAKKPGGFKSYLGLTKEKSEYMIEFEVEKKLFSGRLRGGRDHIWFSNSNVTIPRDAIRYHGPTSGWKA